jgi:hypothetical protein
MHGIQRDLSYKVSWIREVKPEVDSSKQIRADVSANGRDALLMSASVGHIWLISSCEVAVGRCVSTVDEDRGSLIWSGFGGEEVTCLAVLSAQE